LDCAGDVGGCGLRHPTNFKADFGTNGPTPSNTFL
jgi:hypothetical protein